MKTCKHLILFCLFCLLALGACCFMFNTGVPPGGDDLHSLRIRVAIQWQLVWFAVGLVLTWQVARQDYHRWRVWSFPLMVSVWCALALCLVSNPFLKIIDWTRWLGLGHLSVCPARWAPPALALFLASFYSSARPAAEKREADTERLGPISVLAENGVPLAACVYTAILVTGHSAMAIRILLFLTAICVAAAARATKTVWGLVILGIASCTAVLLRYPFLLHQFLYDFFTKYNRPHSILLSLRCINTGGWFGIGLGQSANRLYIPNATEMSEFMTAVIGEELGLIIVLLIVALMVTLLLAGLYLSLHAHDRFGKLLATSVTALLGFQTLFHFTAIFNWTNFIGIPMPFISEIGSNACVPLFCAGLLLSVATRSPPFSKTADRDPKRSPPDGSRPATVWRTPTSPP